MIKSSYHAMREPPLRPPSQVSEEEWCVVFLSSIHLFVE